MRRRLWVLLLILLVFQGPPARAQDRERLEEPIRGIVFDPTYYLELRLPPEELAGLLTTRWRRHGVKVVYVNAYNVVYGAHYRTRYPFNRMDALGEADFLQVLIREAHRRGLKVFAAFYHHNHLGAWERNPAWRAKRRNGTDYNPKGHDANFGFLSIWHPDVRKWWLGLLEEVLVNYPDLDGIELREPVINWWAAEADYNEHAIRAFRQAHPNEPLGGRAWLQWRANGLTALLKDGIRLIHSHRRAAHVTSAMSAWGDGRLLTAAEQASHTGFDLDGLLSGEDRPDALKVELIWQQWGNVYKYKTFSPTWTGRATREALAMIGGRVRTVVHVELTDFGQRRVTPEETYLAIRAARQAGATEFDVYGAEQADEKGAWPWLERAFMGSAAAPAPRSRPGPVRRVLVLEDDDPQQTTVPKLATTLLWNLLGHFDVLAEVRTVGQYQPGTLEAFDAVIYQGTQWDAPLPPLLLRDLDAYAGNILWIGANLWQLTRGLDLSRFGIVQPMPVRQVTATAISTPAGELTAGTPMPFLSFSSHPRAQTLATVRADHGDVPVAAHYGRFWYVGGYLHRDPERNPAQYLVADLLHDVLQRPHARDRQALLYVTGVSPITDPAHLRRLLEFTQSAGVRPVIGVTPVFVDPVLKVRVALVERPRVVAQLRALVAAGAEIAQVGYTHQFRGRTGVDFEFWDAVTGQARADDSVELVRGRVNAGLHALAETQVFPLAWTTPGHRASPFDYTIIGDVFSVMLERRFYGFAEGRPVLQRFPYAVWSDLHGHTVLSPNIILDSRQDVGQARDEARELSAVRGALGVVVVPVDAPVEALQALVDEMRKMGYAFTHLRALRSIRVVGDRLAIVAGEERIRLEVARGQYLRVIELAPDGRARAVSLRRAATFERYAPTIRTPPDAIRVVEVLSLHPWGLQAVGTRVQMAARGWLQDWANTRGTGRVSMVLRLAVTVLSAVTLLALVLTVVALPFLAIAGLVRQRRQARARPWSSDGR